MGATVVHGKGLTKREESLQGGERSIEILPVEGGYEFPAYSSVRDMIDYAASCGVDPSLWPTHYDTLLSELTIDTIYHQCRELREALSRLPSHVISAHAWLERVTKWLNSGECFCVLE